MIMKAIGIFFLVLCFAPLQSLAGAKDESARKLCTEHYKQNHFEEAIDCYRSLLIKTPDDHELHRLIGSAHARIGNRVAAYQSYKMYAKVCPDCMYTPAIKRILQDYEKLKIKESKPTDKAGSTSSISATRKARAKALTDKARAIRKTDPRQARDLCKQVRLLVGPTDPSHKRCKAMFVK
jgi:tetratricopeptide (TPR) repeat protein